MRVIRRSLICSQGAKVVVEEGLAAYHVREQTREDLVFGDDEVRRSYWGGNQNVRRRSRRSVAWE